ncbi:MAG: hypothetical protein AABY75_04825 [Bacteroidota bacterium]
MTTLDHDHEQREDAPFSPLRRARRANRSPRRWPDIGVILGYTVSAVMAVVGVAVAAGFLVHGGVPDRFRWTFGVVLILMGIYRFFLTRTRVQQKAMEREEEG